MISCPLRSGSGGGRGLQEGPGSGGRGRRPGGKTVKLCHFWMFLGEIFWTKKVPGILSLNIFLFEFLLVDVFVECFNVVLL